MNTYIQNFKKFKPLLDELIARDIKIKYRRSVLGVLWTLLNPLLMMVILSVVFSNLFKFDVDNFPLYLLSGQVIFNFFVSSTTSAMMSIVSSASLIKKIYVPKYLFVLANIFSGFINLLAAFTALLLVMLATRAEFHWTMLLVPIPIMLVTLLALGVGLFLAAVTVKFRDVMHLYTIFTTALLYLTPVIYPMSILPGWLKIIVKINPITNILEIFRDVILNNRIFDITSLAIAVGETALILVLGVYVFYKNQDNFVLNL